MNKKIVIDTIQSKKLFIFDFDGVIVDSVDIKTEAFGEIYSNYGSSITEKVKNYHIENGGLSRYEKIRYFNEVLLKNYNKYKSKDELVVEFSNLVKTKVIECPEIRGATKFLDYLFNCGKMLTVNSATPSDELIEIIQARNLDNYFRVILGSPKTKLENLQQTIESMKCNVAESIFFGDANTDIHAAESIGMDFIGLGNLFKDFSSEVLIASLEDFTELF